LRIGYDDSRMKTITKKLLLSLGFAISIGTATIAHADSILDKLGAPSDSGSALVKGGNVQAVIRPAVDRATPGQGIDVTADFTIAPDWHIYGKPVPSGYTPTSITFDN
jgi:hypothetical protein